MSSMLWPNVCILAENRLVISSDAEAAKASACHCNSAIMATIFSSPIACPCCVGAPGNVTTLSPLDNGNRC
eukprot:CAMPEP_0115722124 /NCGR_PEP_ID=MMETSP0272-20121206/79499_1 /TAXON_ID=71861 /ORGANISM="Scrippsiella trochoidea, Strain CCMP3099" /LENGTH=70 /DNA_ID=CAMNT_0003165103 /DNA_START=309 /DNA_END=518 /DNA_ORIENTATION=-